jgi:hypothetical protein
VTSNVVKILNGFGTGVTFPKDGTAFSFVFNTGGTNPSA